MQQKDIHYIDKVLDGDSGSFAILVNRYKNMVFTIVKRILKSHEDAEEVAQDVFIKAYQSLNKFKKEAKFSTWLYRIAFNTAVSKTRKKKFEVSAIDDNMVENYTHDDLVEELDEFVYEDRKKYFENALKKIPQEDALLLTMFYMEEQTIEEISTVTGLSASNVKVKLHRIRKKIYETIDEMIKLRVGETL